MASQTSISNSIKTEIDFLEELFKPWISVIGNDYQGYHNHVYRMVQICWALAENKGEILNEEDKQKIMIAAVFHDIGIWTDNTVDYIEPSIPPAMNYLEEHGLAAWQEEITLMISEHHKFRPYRGKYERLIELFRQADLVDFSLGTVKKGLPNDFLQALKHHIPNAGFHKGLLNKGFKWFLKNPLNPAPMFKW